MKRNEIESLSGDCGHVSLRLFSLLLLTYYCEVTFFPAGKLKSIE
jgi:hypothetical protein